MLLPELPSYLQDTLSTIMAVYTALFLVKELTSPQKECVSVPMLVEFTVLPVLHCSEAAGLMEWWDVLLKNQLQHPAGGSTLQTWVRFLQKAVKTLNALLVAVSPKAGIHESRVEVEVALLTVGSPADSDSKESACNTGDACSIPGLGRSSGEGNRYPLRYSCLENPMGRGAWWATVHRVTKSQT